MTIRVNGLEAHAGNFGKDWADVLDLFLLALPVEDDGWVTATLDYRPPQGDHGTCGAKYVNLSNRDYVQRVEFDSLMAKQMVVRHYTIARHNGAPPIVARWMVDREVQRLVQGTRDDVFNDHSFSHLRATFADTREDFEKESDDRDEAFRILSDATTGGYWDWEDGELWLVETDDEGNAICPECRKAVRDEWNEVFGEPDIETCDC